MSFEEKEDKDGVRLTWNCLPRLALQHQRNVVPAAALYTPFNNKSEVPTLGANQMLRCRQCKAFLNPYVTVNQQSQDIWYCQFCSFGNRLHISEQGNYPLALSSDYSTVEYVTEKRANFPPIFIFVVDTCFEGEDVTDAFASLKESLVLSLSLLPGEALFGLVTYGKHVQLHDLSEPARGHVFNGGKEYASADILKLLRLNLAGLGNTANATLGSTAQHFLQSVENAEYLVSQILEQLVTNTFPHKSSRERAERSTGCALNIAALFLETVLGKSNSTGGHIVCFVGGPATHGPGRIVGTPLKEPIRSHHDIDKVRMAALPNISNGVAKVDASLFKLAKVFYSKVAKVLVSMGITCDVFVGAYDQVGLCEMDEVCVKSGGAIVMCDSFSTSIFKQSLVKLFRKVDDDPESELAMALNANLECRVTKDFKIQGLIGHALALPIRKDRYVDSSVSSQSLGEGDTNSWKLGSCDSQSTYAIYFEKLDSSQATHAFIQFIFQYQHASGSLRVRVTTVPVAIIADQDSQNLEAGFDQEAALVAVGRHAIDKLHAHYFSERKSTFDHTDVIKHLDKLLILFCSRFAQYQKGVLSSFRLSSSFAMLPQFLYHLRRSPFIKVFNNSPDETSFVRHVFMHEDVTNSLIMVQPTLLSYDVETYGAADGGEDPNYEPEPVLLDSMSLGKTKVLLLDTFFHILIYHGGTVAQWRKEHYQDQEGYEHFKEFLLAPRKEAMEILMDRFPLPRYIDCDEGGSQARFLMAKLNPSTSYSSNPNHLYGGQLDVLTDDTSLQLFMDHTQRIVVGRK